MRYLIVVFLFIINLSNAQAPPPLLPVPTGNPYQLFYLQRTHNINTIVYELNMKNGVLDKEEPVHAFWIRFAEKSQRQELSFIQRKFAYGLKCKLVAPDKYEVHFVSYKKYVMHLVKEANNNYRLYATINKKNVLLNRIFMKIKTGGSFWSPNIESVEIKGTDPATSTEITEVVKI